MELTVFQDFLLGNNNVASAEFPSCSDQNFYLVMTTHIATIYKKYKSKLIAIRSPSVTLLPIITVIEIQCFILTEADKKGKYHNTDNQINNR